MYTITITKENPHRKFKIADEKIGQLVKILKKQADREKVTSGVIPFKTESIAFINAIEASLETYRGTCLVSEDKTYTDEEIDALVALYGTLVQQKADLLADAEINDIQANDEFQRIVARVAELKEIRAKLIAAGWTNT